MTQGDPSISFITVCRNSERTIAGTVESVVSQKDQGDEYIVIDGASTDSTLQILHRLNGIDLLVSEPDRGVADAFNKGIARARGEIVALVNSDDRLVSGAVQRIRREFGDDPLLDVLHGDILLVDGETVLKRIKPSRFWWEPWRLVLFNHPATFVRRRVYERFGGFDCTHLVAMDVDIFFRWLSNGVRMKYVPEVYTLMQQGGVSGRLDRVGYGEFRDAAIRHGRSPLMAWVQYGSKLVLSRSLRLLRL